MCLLAKFVRNLNLFDGVAVLELDQSVNEDVSDFINAIAAEKIATCSFLDLKQKSCVEVSLLLGLVESAKD